VFAIFQTVSLTTNNMKGIYHKLMIGQFVHNITTGNLITHIWGLRWWICSEYHKKFALKNHC